MNQETPLKERRDGPSCNRCGAPLAGEAPCPACMLEGARRGAPAFASSTGGPRGAFEAPSIQALAAALPAYEIQVLIGQGGMGAVYRARHRKLDRMVAIKVLRPLELDDPVLAADFTERFEREARVLAKLDHPHIVRIYDFGRADSPEAFFYLALEYVDGASLRELMGEGRLSPKEVLELIPQVCEALQTAHSLGVIHRDIKPENILVDSEGRVRIADFGLAKLSGLEPDAMGLTQSHQTFGSLHYMAPEQMRSASNVDHRADLYSLGVVVYEMLTGELPLGRFAAPSKKVGSETGLDDVVLRALENEPDERYQGASDLKDDLVAGDSTPSRKESVGIPRVSGRGAFAKAIREPEARGPLAQQAVKAEAARAKSDAVRAWVVFGILTVVYSLPWLVISSQAVAVSAFGGELAGDVAFPRGLELKVEGHQVSALGIPAWAGLLAIFAVAVLRSMQSEGRSVDRRIAVGLGAFGTALMLSIVVNVSGQGFAGSFKSPFYIALIVYAANSFMDFNGAVNARIYQRLKSRPRG